MIKHWLVKSEPENYSWDNLVRDKHTVWDGVRNFSARNHLAEMKTGDQVLFYHSNEGKEVVGLAKVSREAYPDPSAGDSKWVVCEITAVRPLKHAVTLVTIKADRRLQNMALVKQGRLSVMPVSLEEFERIMELGNAT